MENGIFILAINPGSTSTKVALFDGETCVNQKSLLHSADELKKFEKVTDQFRFRADAVWKWLKDEDIDPSTLSAVVGRGGLLRSMPGGTYEVSDTMIDDLYAGIQGEHVSNLGGIIAREIADSFKIPAFIVDPVAVDEFDDIARFSGLPELPRRSLVHALNIKAVSRRVAKKLGRDLKDINLIVAHLGGGISISPVKRGRIVDVNNATEGGPFSPDRAGTLPAADIINLCFSGKYTLKEMKKKINGNAGLIGYLGVNDGREIERMILSGDKQAKIIFEAMCYQIAKEIAAMATVVSGDVDAIVLTGGLAYSERLVKFVSQMVGFIAPIEVVPGEDEMLSLAQGAYRVLIGDEKAKVYENEVFKR
jgi:butyrate kinase